MLRFTILSIVALANSVSAKELPEPTMMTLTSGVICDTEEQVQSMLKEISLGNPRPQIEGCGFIRGMFPARIDPLYWYETPAASSLLARFTHPFTGYTQYGWIAFEMKTDEPDPASLDIDA